MKQVQQPSSRYALVALFSIAGFCFLMGLVAAALVGMGTFNVAADRNENHPLGWLLRTVREHSVTARATAVAVPHDLADDRRIRRGAAEYAEMCVLCHAGPGVERSELSQGLSPPAPELTRDPSLSPAQQFWIIKHGIRMTAMPSWGATHDDKILWDIVAFLQQLPSLSAEQYRDMTKNAHEDHDEMKDMHEGH